MIIAAISVKTNIVSHIHVWLVIKLVFGLYSEGGGEEGGGEL